MTIAGKRVLSLLGVKPDRHYNFDLVLRYIAAFPIEHIGYIYLKKGKKIHPLAASQIFFSVYRYANYNVIKLLQTVGYKRRTVA